MSSWRRNATSLGLLGLLLSGSFSAPLSVFAVTAPASYLASSTPLDVTLAPGEEKNLVLAFRNLGSSSWRSGLSGAALYVYGDTSPFEHRSWLKRDLPAVLTPAVIPPGSTALVSFWVKAPTAAGTYTQDFLLSSATDTWIKGSRVRVTFRVGTGSSASSPVTSTPAPAPVVSAPAPTPAPATVAADASLWKAEIVDRGGIEWQTDPQGHLMITVSLKNKGTQAWTNEGTGKINFVTKEKRKSVFKDSSWANEIVATTLKEKRVRPGETGTFVLQLRGPDVPGKYQETFQLALEDGKVLSGSDFSFPIQVTTPRDYIAKGIPNGVDPSLVESLVAKGSYRGSLLLKSVQQVILSGNGRQLLTFGMKNVGTATWNNLALRLTGLQPAVTGRAYSLRDESWVTASEPVRGQIVTGPGQLGLLSFKLKVPAKKGSYTAKFQLYADGQAVEDGMIDIPITVTADGYIEPEPVLPPSTPITPTTPSTPSTSPAQPIISVPPLGSFIVEPNIRVGLYKTTDNQMRLKGIKTGFNLQNGGATVCSFALGQEVTVQYDRAARIYRASGSGCTTQSSSIYVAVATDGLSPLEITDYVRNDNEFRGKLELRYTPATDSVWIINELPLEWYLKGIGETSNVSPQQFQRTLLTTARTYAMYHVQRSTKHADENYTVDATYDQVYRGWGAEARNPNVVAAIDATRGQIVTYGGQLAITPYFSRSDGRTRNWTEVWGGKGYPWLVSVPVPQDAGKTLWGHGVGMSATGALGMANEGRTYVEILKHFYPGTETRQIYQ